ncbi:MAG TPA: NADH-quinone oxidoreductase subunit L, partial [Solirubrobacteraceae bacterium]
RGHLFHAETPFNPQSGETEDTDVGFPGPEHHIAERDWAMRFPMGMLALLAIIGGVIQIPGIDDAITRFLAPTFAGSHLYHLEGSTGSDWVGLIVGAVIGLIGISIAYRIWVAKVGTAPALQARFGAVHTFLYNKWYFDELIDLLVVRPGQWLGRFAGSVLERGVIGGAVTGGTVGVVRAASAAVRRAQNGFLRYYAAAMIVGVSAMALYFLVSAT